MELVIFLSSMVVFATFALMPLARKSGAPILLIVLGVGMLLGVDGPGGIRFYSFQTGFDLGSFALAIILFAGGLETERDMFHNARNSSVMMATLGVLVTALIVGLFASFVLGMPPVVGLLLGATVASTDAAATFLLIQQSKAGISERVKNTLVLESGLNDPMAIFLVVSLTAVVNGGPPESLQEVGGFLAFLASQIGIGLIGGIFGGRVLTLIIDRMTLPNGTYPAMALSGALAIYAAVALLGGSGFLAVYIVGIVIRNRLIRPLDNILNFNEALQWISQMALFLMLGLLVAPSHLLKDIWAALAIAGVLMFIARPLDGVLRTREYLPQLGGASRRGSGPAGDLSRHHARTGDHRIFQWRLRHRRGVAHRAGLDDRAARQFPQAQGTGRAGRRPRGGRRDLAGQLCQQCVPVLQCAGNGIHGHPLVQAVGIIVRRLHEDAGDAIARNAFGAEEEAVRRTGGHLRDDRQPGRLPVDSLADGGHPNRVER